MKHLDLFSGIGGFALAARWVGWETVGFCEIEPFCQKVLAKHWPGIPIYDDIKEVTAERLRADGITTDIITGGFPCQDISLAGKGAGIEGSRSGLWSEFARLIGEIRPAYAVMENVSALLGRGLERVAGDLAEIGYDCEWEIISAANAGFPHRRERVWITAYPCGDRLQGQCDGRNFSAAQKYEPGGEIGGTPSQDAPDAIGGQRSFGGTLRRMGREEPFSRDRCGQITSEPFVCRGTHGISNRSHRLRSLGNAIVPQCAEVIFRAINGS